MLSLKAAAAGPIITGGLALAVVGIAPVANAAPSTLVVSGPQWLAENGPGSGTGHGHDDWWWDGPKALGPDRSVRQCPGAVRRCAGQRLHLVS